MRRNAPTRRTSPGGEPIRADSAHRRAWGGRAALPEFGKLLVKSTSPLGGEGPLPLSQNALFQVVPLLQHNPQETAAGFHPEVHPLGKQ